VAEHRQRERHRPDYLSIMPRFKAWDLLCPLGLRSTGGFRIDVEPCLMAFVESERQQLFDQGSYVTY
jgi:hypothetical protein